METAQPTVSVSDANNSGMSRQKGILIAVIAAVLFAAGSVYYIQNSGDADASSLAPATVTVSKDGFNPATIRVKKGQRVTWWNRDLQQHQVASESVDALKSNRSTVLNRDDTATVTFEQAGTYQYHDSLSSTGFQGTVIVE